MQAESHRALWDMSMFNLPNLQGDEPPADAGPLALKKMRWCRLSWSRRQPETYGLHAHIFRDMGQQ
ncbi:MAG: hypothetical protein IPJ38_21365 [Dechloromonas sp.]|uniref:Uncharacterized protein n=1 Tax=Candidatus Dechloromonas phosphorivorans TaxID=2899244 RepID=A0A935K0N0_9RHOO|nr:hypothetical protein [Candidatus Dechloromonas phosphorivorans]